MAHLLATNIASLTVDGVHPNPRAMPVMAPLAEVALTNQ
jgi:lysophospholipase L1-like esterase